MSDSDRNQTLLYMLLMSSNPLINQVKATSKVKKL